MSLLERVGDEPEGALPGAVEQVEGAVHPLPVLQVEERVRYRLGVAPLFIGIDDSNLFSESDQGDL